MSRILIFILAFALMLSAGVVVGRLSIRRPPMPPPPPGPAWFDEQLRLSVDQRKQMETIWSETRQKIEKGFDRYRSLEAEREQAIGKILSSEQKGEYDKIVQTWRDQRGEIERDRQKCEAEANDRSRGLLDEGQRKRWDELKQMRERNRGHRGGPRGPRGPSTERATTEPFGRPGPDSGGPERP